MGEATSQEVLLNPTNHTRLIHLAIHLAQAILPTQAVEVLTGEMVAGLPAEVAFIQEVLLEVDGQPSQGQLLVVLLQSTVLAPLPPPPKVGVVAFHMEEVHLMVEAHLMVEVHLMAEVHLMVEDVDLDLPMEQ